MNRILVLAKLLTNYVTLLKSFNLMKALYTEKRAFYLAVTGFFGGSAT